MFTLIDGAFTIQGRGTAVLTGISSAQTLGLAQGDSIVFRTPYIEAHRAKVVAVELALKPDGEEYALILDGVTAKDLPTGSLFTGILLWCMESVLLTPSIGRVIWRTIVQPRADLYCCVLR